METHHGVRVAFHGVLNELHYIVSSVMMRIMKMKPDNLAIGFASKSKTRQFSNELQIAKLSGFMFKNSCRLDAA